MCNKLTAKLNNERNGQIDKTAKSNTREIKYP